MRPDLLRELAMFEVIATEGSFTRAARRLGITQSALSQSLKRLENELGFRLLHRTTRSTSPTEAGARVLAKLSPALEEIAAEVGQLSDDQSEPVGTIKVTAGKHAADTILWPALVPLMRENPGIEVEVCVQDDYVDIVAERFDAGIRLGERLEKDMVAVPIGPRMRIAVVASPEYLALHGTPTKPVDISQHQCISFRNGSGELSPWTFEQDKREISVKPGRGPVFNDGDLMVAAATEGFGLLYIIEDLVDLQLSSGALVRVLQDWSEPFTGYHLYFATRHQHTRAFRKFVEALKYPLKPG
ncbi:MAG: LysR family transcriptional regulator [Gammaproteobacteria bacterium]|uniref:LysR family transcriptional regulator n=1 Tax=Vreelandella titanicae TaxID=664683 RepID=A0A558JAK3_9GAMM|nr:LysR family transcriptional regulator [Halomonas titanicae]MBR9904223.1 LysR family transcriptional regulator [Gammaproteobacteria bacterium]TVU90675.1 LysR family transcriptional regulator [Halomonas titanicae]